MVLFFSYFLTFRPWNKFNARKDCIQNQAIKMRKWIKQYHYQNAIGCTSYIDSGLILFKFSFQSLDPKYGLLWPWFYFKAWNWENGKDKTTFHIKCTTYYILYIKWSYFFLIWTTFITNIEMKAIKGHVIQRSRIPGFF